MCLEQNSSGLDTGLSDFSHSVEPEPVGLSCPGQPQRVANPVGPVVGKVFLLATGLKEMFCCFSS